MIEALPYICIQDVFVLLLDIQEYRPNRILTGPSWSKSIAIWFEFGFPFWFQSIFGDSLFSPVPNRRHQHSTLPPFPSHLWIG